MKSQVISATISSFLLKLILNFFLVLTCVHITNVSTLQAQFLQSSFYIPSIFPEPGKAAISIKSVTFFHNNEFFHPLVKGYTLTGTWLQPELQYSFNEVFSASGGIHLLKYHGMEPFTRALPVFSFTYMPSENISLTLGNFPGGENHRISEVLFKPERHFSLFPEGGLSINMKNRFAKSELWVNWERIIFHGDPFNEEVTAGSGTYFQLRKTEKVFTIQLPLQILAKHRGGQINTGDRSVDTWWNMLTGLEAQKPLGGKVFHEFSLMLHLPFYYYEGETGYGFFPQLGTEILGNKISLGYFRAKDFKTIHGIGLYESFQLNMADNNYIEGGKSELITLKVGFSKKIHEQVSFVSRLDAWYDVRRSKVDYLSGLYLIVNFNNTPGKIFRRSEGN